MMGSPIDVAHAALMDAGRPDLANGVAWYDEGDDGYLETLDELDDPLDVAMIDRAEELARQWIHEGPR